MNCAITPAFARSAPICGDPGLRLPPRGSPLNLPASEKAPKAAVDGGNRRSIFRWKSTSARGDFYILCPDNDVDRATDEKRNRLGAAGRHSLKKPPAICRGMGPRTYKATVRGLHEGNAN